jgi:hypothetical protein
MPASATGATLLFAITPGEGAAIPVASFFVQATTYKNSNGNITTGFINHSIVDDFIDYVVVKPGCIQQGLALIYFSEWLVIIPLP